MTTSNVTLTTHFLAKRGNTSVSTTYTGLVGELTVDTDLNTVRVHDGSTAGGHILANTSQLSSVQLDTLNANVGAYQTYANVELNSLLANAAVQAAVLDTLSGNAVTQETQLIDLLANAASQADSLTTLIANAASQANDLTAITSFQTYANSTFVTSSTVDTLDANVGTIVGTTIPDLDANLGTATTNIATLQSQVYANANVKTYLSEFDGNIIPSANATYYLGDSTHQWKELWVTGNTIYLGDIPLSMSTASEATLYVNNQPVVANVTNVIDANIGTATTNITNLQSDVTTLDANLGTATTNITNLQSDVTNIDANIGAYQTWANASINTLDANVGTITTDLTTLFANAAAQASVLDTLSGNAVTQQSELAVLVANAASQADDLTTLLANAAVQTDELTTLTANAAAQAGAIDTINANVGSYQTYANATFASSTDFGNFTLTNNTITTDNGDDGIDLKIFGADSNDPPAFIQRTWRLAVDGSIRFLDPFLSSTLANGTINTTKIGQWDNTYANLVPSINANIGAYQAYANATFSTDTALNANVGAFQTYANLTFATGSDIDTLDANVGAYQTWANANLGGGGISNVVEDTTPQLGGNLDLNSSSITGTGNINTTGDIIITGNVYGSVNGYEIGYRNIPQVGWSSNVVLGLTDGGKHYYTTSASTITVTVPTNANVAFEIGDTVNFMNQGNATCSINLQSGVTMYLAGNSTSGARTLSGYGVASLTKVATDTWFITGVGVA